MLANAQAWLAMMPSLPESIRCHKSPARTPKSFLKLWNLISHMALNLPALTPSPSPLHLLKIFTCIDLSPMFNLHQSPNIFYTTCSTEPGSPLKICFLCSLLKCWLLSSSWARHAGHGHRVEFSFIQLLLWYSKSPPSSLKWKQKQNIFWSVDLFSADHHFPPRL